MITFFPPRDLVLGCFQAINEKNRTKFIPRSLCHILVARLKISAFRKSCRSKPKNQTRYTDR